MFLHLVPVAKPAWAVLLAIAGSLQSTPAAAPAPNVQALLQHLRTEISLTAANLPDISCDESLRSTWKHHGHMLGDVREQAVLHVRRRADLWGDFAEERRVVKQDGKPVQNRKLRKLPFVITDGFGTTFATFLGSDYQNCNRYQLLPSGAADGSVLVLQVERVKPANPKSCIGLDAGTVGVFWINGHTYQIEKFGVSEPHGPTFHGSKKSPLYGLQFSLNTMTAYHLVPLGAKLFLLPREVHATAKTASGKDQLGYDASYSSCLLYSATSKILYNSAPGTPYKPTQ